MVNLLRSHQTLKFIPIHLARSPPLVGILFAQSDCQFFLQPSIFFQPGIQILPQGLLSLFQTAFQCMNAFFQSRFILITLPLDYKAKEGEKNAGPTG